MIFDVRRRIALVAAVGALLLGTTSNAVASGDAVPTPDQVANILNRVLDPDLNLQDKSTVVTPGLSSEDEPQIDAALTRLTLRYPPPLDFVVTDIQPAPNDDAGATVAAANLPGLSPTPVVLNRQGNQWKITENTLMPLIQAIYHAARHHAAP